MKKIKITTICNNAMPSSNLAMYCYFWLALFLLHIYILYNNITISVNTKIYIVYCRFIGNIIN